MNPSQLSHELRNGRSGHLRRRRVILGLSLLSTGCMGLVGLYQMGVLRRLPAPRGRGFNSESINASPQSYAKHDVPHALLALKSYTTTLVLAAFGGLDRARVHPWAPLALLAKALIDAGQAIKLTHDEKTRHRACCIWTLAAAAAASAIVGLAIPEALEGWREYERRWCR